MPAYKRSRVSAYSFKAQRPKGYKMRARSSRNYTVGPKPEVKFFDSAFPAAGIPAGAASIIDSTLVAEIVNGTGPSQRIGRKIKVLRIDYSLSVWRNGAASGTATDAFRYDIWLDRQSNGAAPGPADLYTAIGGGTPGTCEMLNLSNEKRFKRLFTHVEQTNIMSGIGAANPAADVGIKFEGSIYPKCVIEYDNSAGLITDLTSNNLFQSWSSDAGSYSVRTAVTRVHYSDV